MLFRRPVDLQQALKAILEPDTIFSIDDAMRQFASEPDAPAGDYRIVERGKPNAQRAYVVRRIQQEGGFATGYNARTGKRIEPRQAQRIVAEGVKEPRSVTAPRWKRIQAGARASFRLYNVEPKLRALSDKGTNVDMRGIFIIENDPRTFRRTIHNVYIQSKNDPGADPVTAAYWEAFIQDWRAGDFVSATRNWNEAYFRSFCGYVGYVYDITWLLMETIATAQERKENEKEAA